MKNNMFRLSMIAGTALALGACNAVDRVAAIGAEPALAPIENPVLAANYQPVSMPMPQPEPTIGNANSLWRTGARSFFKDQRASKVGDILTVTIEIADSATVSNRSRRSRDNAEDAAIDGLFGLQNNALSGMDPGNIVDLSSESQSDGRGDIARNETINLEVAAVVTQVLPNGNLVIHGVQEVRVNYEVRELLVDGVVRPEDITASNQVSHDQIAEARIAYGGRGQITDVQQPRYGQQLLDIIYPF